MTQMHSFDIEKNGTSPTSGKAHNPYGPGGSSHQSPLNTARTYGMFCLALFVIYSVGKLMIPSSNEEIVVANSHGGAAGGWGTANHPVVSKHASKEKNEGWNTPVTHYHEEKQQQNQSAGKSSYNTEHAELEIRESDLLMMLSPLVFIPSHSRPEYEKYQSDPKSISGGESSYSEDVLYDKNTPHGMAFDFMLNRDKRPVNVDDPLLVQRFVVTLIFYATGGKDTDPTEASMGEEAIGQTSGWDSSMAHFLTGLHECHWVKKSLEDQFWSMLSIENGSDRRVGVTKCNADMEVIEIRLCKYSYLLWIGKRLDWTSLCKDDHFITLISSSFCHQQKLI